jgi:hypothetical protein
MSTHGEAVEDIKKAKDVIDHIPTPVKETKYPDAKKHLYISLVKSGFRIGAGIALVRGELITAGALLIFAELLGIAEELV